jgi:hypothetical protein
MAAKTTTREPQSVIIEDDAPIKEPEPKKDKLDEYLKRQRASAKGVKLPPGPRKPGIRKE